MTKVRFSTYGGYIMSSSSEGPWKIQGGSSTANQWNQYPAECRFYAGEADELPDCDLWAREPPKWTLSPDIS